jgi:hypothetical protein
VTLEEYYTTHSYIQSLLGPGDFRFALLGAYHEIGEALDHLPWRPWRVTDHRTPSKEEIARALPEITDSIGALTRALVNLGVEPKDFVEAMRGHLRTKLDRIGAGIDRLPT